MDMLLRSKSKNEKIVLGLLSYTHEDGTSNEEQRELLERYRQDETKEIYLYKDEESENYVGILAVEHNITETFNDVNEPVVNENILIHRVAVIPSFRNEGVGFRMYTQLRDMLPHATIIGTTTNQTVELVSGWAKQYNERHTS